MRFKTFSKYDFVKSYVAATKDEKLKAQKEQEASIIADAIAENQNIIFENLATKEEFQLGIKSLEMSTKRDLEVGLKSLEKEIRVLEISTKKDLEALESRLTIKLTAIMAALLTLLPIATDFIRHLLKL